MSVRLRERFTNSFSNPALLTVSQHREQIALSAAANFVCMPTSYGHRELHKGCSPQTADYIGYHIGRELAELHPGKTIIEGDTGYFDLEGFVRAESISVN